MKTFKIIFCVVLAITSVCGFFNGKLPGEVEKLMEECQTKLGLTDEQLEKLLESKNETEIGCLFACINKGTGIMEGNKLNRDKIEKTIKEVMEDEEEELVLNTVKVALNCEEETRSEHIENECELNGKYIKCIVENVSTDKKK